MIERIIVGNGIVQVKGPRAGDGVVVVPACNIYDCVILDITGDIGNISIDSCRILVKNVASNLSEILYDGIGAGVSYSAFDRGVVVES